jgi:hypothetical protein
MVDPHVLTGLIATTATSAGGHRTHRAVIASACTDFSAPADQSITLKGVPAVRQRPPSPCIKSWSTAPRNCLKAASTEAAVGSGGSELIS